MAAANSGGTRSDLPRFYASVWHRAVRVSAAAITATALMPPGPGGRGCPGACCERSH